MGLIPRERKKSSNVNVYNECNVHLIGVYECQCKYKELDLRVSLRDPAEEGGGAAGTRGQARARGERRGHHPVAPHRGGVQRLRGRGRVRRGRLDGMRERRTSFHEISANLLPSYSFPTNTLRSVAV